MAVLPAGRTGIRDRFNAFVARHDIAWELGMGALAIIFVALGFLLDEAGSGTKPDLELLELAITAVFVAEFATRIAAAHDRRQYLLGHWIDLVALAPPIRAARAPPAAAPAPGPGLRRSREARPVDDRAAAAIRLSSANPRGA